MADKIKKNAKAPESAGMQVGNTGVSGNTGVIAGKATMRTGGNAGTPTYKEMLGAAVNGAGSTIANGTGAGNAGAYGNANGMTGQTPMTFGALIASGNNAGTGGVTAIGGNAPANDTGIRAGMRSLYGNAGAGTPAGAAFGSNAGTGDGKSGSANGVPTYAEMAGAGGSPGAGVAPGYGEMFGTGGNAGANGAGSAIWNGAAQGAGNAGENGATGGSAGNIRDELKYSDLIAGVDSSRLPGAVEAPADRTVGAEDIRYSTGTPSTPGVGTDRTTGNGTSATVSGSGTTGSGTTGSGTTGSGTTGSGTAESGTTGNGTAGNTYKRPMTYEEYLESKKNSYATDREDTRKYYEERLEKERAEIEARRKEEEEAAARQKETSYAAAIARREREEREAEEARQRSVVDARSDLETNRATYGTRAEQLAAMGLSGSGYGDYLDSAAYAASRGEIQSANAAAERRRQSAADTESDTKLAADSTYGNAIAEAGRSAREDLSAAEKEADEGKFAADLTYRNNIRGMEDEEQSRRDTAESKAEEKRENTRNAYVTLLSGANNGTYSEDQLKDLAGEYGLDEAQTEVLVAAAKKYQSKTAAAARSEWESSVAGQTESMIDAGVISREEGSEQLMENYRNTFGSDYTDTETARSEIRKVESALKKGYISETDYRELQDTYNEQLRDSVDDLFAALTSREAAEREYKKLVDTGWLSQETKDALEAKMNEVFKVPRTNWVYNKNASARALANKGNNFKLVLSVNEKESTEYKVESGGKYAENNIEELNRVKNAAKNLHDDQVFAWGDLILMKKEGNFYIIKARNTDTSREHYAALRKQLGLE